MKKKLYINACRLFSLSAIVMLFVACDAHRDFPDTAMKPCHILCTDGKVLSVSDFKQSEKQPIAVVFHVNHDEAIEGNGYAVYLWDLAPEAFADSIGVNQRTSTDITALDGNENTFAIYEPEKPPRLWQKQSSPCGGTDSRPISHPWHRCGCSIMPRAR